MKRFFKDIPFLAHENEENRSVELRISGSWTIAIFIAVTLIATLAALALANSPGSTARQNLALVMCILSGSAIFISDRRPHASIFFILVSFTLCVFLGSYLLRLPDLLFILSFSVALAAVVKSLRAAFFLAAGETILLVLFLASRLFWSQGSLLLCLVLIWLVFLVMLAIYLPVYQAVNWYRTNYNQAQTEMEQLRLERESRVQLIEDLDNANRQMAALYDKTSLLRQIAEDAERSKALFVAKVSHEFRTPLSMIIGLAGLMLKNQDIYGTALPAELVEDMNVINRNCDHLARLVNDVLDLTRAEAGQLTIYRDWTDIPPEIEEAVSEIRPLLAKKKLELKLEMPGSLPRVYCDRLRIRQVVLNLVGNAARYTERGGIKIKVSADDHYITFRIADTGPGIQNEDLELIFEPFARGHNHPTGETSGSGLGLSICRQFVELHNGQIWVSSEPGKGSDFSFKIPIYPQEPPQTNPARWISQEKIWSDRKPRLTVDSTPTRERIMVFDPTGMLPVLLHHRSNDIDFVNVGSLEEMTFQSKHNPVSAVLVNGRTAELAVQIVEQCRERLFDTPVIGCVFPSYLEHLKESGVAAYLTKPVGYEELQRAIQQTHRPVRRILIVDDDNDLRKLMLRMLSTDGHFQVYTASSGEEALKLVPALHPDLLLLDIVLGDMSGWDLLQVKNSSPGLSDISVIILSGQDPQIEQLTTPVMLSTFGDGLPVDKLLESALGFASIVFKTE